MVAKNNHADNKTYTLPYQFLVGFKVFFGRKILRHKQWEMDHVTNYLSENINGGMILDVGCSTGHLTKCLSNRFGSNRVAGADISFNSVKRNRNLYDDINFHHIHNGFYNDHEVRYSAITLMHVLEHIVKPVEFINEVTKLLDDNGILVISVPQERIRGDLAIFENIFNIVRGKFQNVHLRNYTFKSLSNQLDSAGLQIQDFKYNSLLRKKSNYVGLMNHSLIMYTKKQ